MDQLDPLIDDKILHMSGIVDHGIEQIKAAEGEHQKVKFSVRMRGSGIEVFVDQDFERPRHDERDKVADDSE